MATLDPYRKWLGIPPEEQPPNHYRLLGIGLFESDADAICNAADRQMSHVRTFQGGEHAELSQEILNQLAAARVCLLDAQRKAEYDGRLRRQVAVDHPSPVPPPLPAPPLPPPGPSRPPVALPPVPPPVTDDSPALPLPTAPGNRSTRRTYPSWLGSVIALVVVLVSLGLLAWVLDGSELERPANPGVPAEAREGGGPPPAASNPPARTWPP